MNQTIRSEQINEFFWNETEEIETKRWRKYISPSEMMYVEKLVIKYDNVYRKLFFENKQVEGYKIRMTPEEWDNVCELDDLPF